MSDIYVYTFPLPGIREIARQNPDGTITVLVEESLGHEQRLEAVNHALGHALNDDWRGGAVGSIESDAHRPSVSAYKASISRFNLSDEEIPILAPKRP